MADLPIEDLRRHFRQFLKIKDTKGNQLYFRYYDPRVLAAFLPNCKPEELGEFFGPVTAFWTKIKGSDEFHHFTLQSG